MAAELSPLSLQEAQLMRLLAGMFGADNVVAQMSVRAICGDNFTEEELRILPSGERWPREAVCLFTILDRNSDSRLVAELLMTDDAQTVDIAL